MSLVKAEQGKPYEELQPAEVTMQELAKKPLSWLGREQLEKEQAEAESRAKEAQTQDAMQTNRRLDSITEKSMNAEMSKLSVKEEPVLDQSIQFSVDLERVHEESKEDLEEVKHPAQTVDKPAFESFIAHNEKNLNENVEVNVNQASFQNPKEVSSKPLNGEEDNG